MRRVGQLTALPPGVTAKVLYKQNYQGEVHTEI